MGLFADVCAVQTTPPWKIRLSKKLSLLRKQLSQLFALSEGQLHNQKTIVTLSRKFRITETDIGMEIEVLWAESCGSCP